VLNGISDMAGRCYRIGPFDSSLSASSFQFLAILDKHFDADHFYSMFVGECSTIISPGHGSLEIIVHQLAEKSNRRKSS